MKITLRIRPDKKEAVCRELLAGAVEFAEDADYILAEKNPEGLSMEDTLLCRQEAELVSLPLHEVCYFESMGKEIFAYSVSGQKYSVGRRIYQLERELPESGFLRISNSVIIKKNAIRKIRPALSQKFVLTLENKAVVDVTRTYYYKFKESFGI